MSPAAAAGAVAADGILVVDGVLVLDGLGGDRRGVVGTSVRDPARPGAGNTSLVVGPQVGDGGDPPGERSRLLAAVGLPPHRAVVMDQVHGGDVAVVADADAGRGLDDHASAVPGVDALVTASSDLGLIVLVADCVPVALVAAGGVAAVHAGRRGVMADVVGAALSALADLEPADPKAGPADVTAVLGPAIGGCCYEVPRDLADEVAAAFPAARATTTWGTPSLDLSAAVEARLRAAGVREVLRVGGCTRQEQHADPGDHGDLTGPGWFSHRTDPSGGRQAMVVARRAEPAATSPAAFLHSTR